MKTFIKYTLLFYLAVMSANSAVAEWTIPSFLLNKVPLKAEDKKQIQQFFLGQVRAYQSGLNCFPKANDYPHALRCAKLVDSKMNEEMKRLEEKNTEDTSQATTPAALPALNEMQTNLAQTGWGEKQKKRMIAKIKQNVNFHQQSYQCLSKAKTVGDLQKCFKGREMPD